MADTVKKKWYRCLVCGERCAGASVEAVPVGTAIQHFHVQHAGQQHAYRCGKAIPTQVVAQSCTK